MAARILLEDNLMFITPAFAQSASPGGSDFFIQFMPFILILVILYFLIIRPQQKRVKDHKSMIESLRRGDTVVTSGGLVGKVVKVVDDKEIQVELAENTRVRLEKSYVASVRVKGEPAQGDSKAKSKKK